MFTLGGINFIYSLGGRLFYLISAENKLKVSFNEWKISGVIA